MTDSDSTRTGISSNHSSRSTLTRTGQPSSRLVYHKVCLTGIAGVGKTSLFLTLKNGEFPDGSRLSTLGIDTFDTAINVDNEFIGMSFNDTLGIERAGTLTSNYFRGATCVLFLFNVEDQYSLECLDEIVEETKSHVSHTSCLFYLVAAKVDLFADITPERVEEKRIELGCQKCFYISSKTGEGLDELVTDVALSVKKKALPGTLPPIKLQPKPMQQNKCSC